MCFGIFKKKQEVAPAPVQEQVPNNSNQAIADLDEINIRINNQRQGNGARTNNANNKNVYKTDITNAAKSGMSDNRADNNRVIEKAIEVSINLGQIFD